MELRLLAGVIATLLACKGSPAGHRSGPGSGPRGAAPSTPTLDVAGFEPPFDQIPIARDFVARHRVAKISIHALEPGTTTARSSEITEYGADGAPVRRYTRAGYEAPELVEEIAYARGEPPPATPGAPSPRLTSKVVVLDRAGRVAQVRTQRGASTVIETLAYDAAGNLTRVAREARGDGEGKRYEELRTYTGGRLSKRTRGEVGAAPFETLAFFYDAGGRFSEWRGAKPGFGDDRYFFTYDASGQLAGMRFQEGTKAIYRRSYTYDADGFLTRIELASAVPAMSDATFVLAYELADGRRRQAIEVTLPAPPRQRTDADVLAAVRRVFPAATGGSVQWGSADGRRYLETVTFQVPAGQVEAATDGRLKEQACALRKALDISECDCEYLERGATLSGVTLVTFHVMLGC